MTKQDRENRVAPPVVAYRTFKNFLRMLAPAMPSQIDKSVMRSMPGGTQTQMLSALRYLNLIGTDGAPKEQMTRMVKSDGPEYKKVLSEVLLNGYPFLKSTNFNLSTATDALLAKQFEALATGDTVRKCITFFVPAALDAGMEISPHIKKPGKRGAFVRKPKKRTMQQDSGHHEEVERGDLSPPPPMNWHQLLLSKFPSFDPNWTDEVKAKWFDSFKDLMEKGEKK